MAPMITSVHAVLPASLVLNYENGERRVFDLTPLLGTGLFASLKDPRIFSRARVSFDTVAWPNGLDIDPERLYEDSVLVEKYVVAEREK